MSDQQILTWEQIEQYATIKHLKKQLTRKARRQRLCMNTLRILIFGTNPNH